jgi:hypothetical protein
MDFSIGLDVFVLGLTIVTKPDDLNAYFQVREAFLAIVAFHVYKFALCGKNSFYVFSHFFAGCMS